jgi:hypothetical protein
MNGHIQTTLETSEPFMSLLQGVDKHKGRNAGSRERRLAIISREISGCPKTYSVRANVA